VFATAWAAPAQQAPASMSPRDQPRQLVLANKPWSGDFDGMIERRLVRVLVPYSRTLYFSDKGRERGITADTVRDFERYINQKYAKQLRNRPITVVMIPTTRDKLLSGLQSGLGDVAAGNLTVTDARLKQVDFVAPPDLRKVSEVVVTGPTSAQIKSADDLAGTTVHVRKASSYYESLMALNERLRKQGKAPATLIFVPDALEDEDAMEMLNAGLFQRIVVDDWKAKMWAQVLPGIKVNDAAAVRTGGSVGWGLRKDSPKLHMEIETFYVDFLKRQGVAAYRLKRYMARIKQITDPTGTAEWRRFEQTLALFNKYGEKYGFDPLMLAAQGYQESQLDQSARSHVGAVGIMQIMPATGAELSVGDIRVAEANVHAGAKYMDQLMTRYFQDAQFSDQDRSLFAFASYNAGPGNISRMRRQAQKRGLDPDRWFNNVEIVTAEKIGQETTTYVRNIFKYYAAYKLSREAEEGADKAREQFQIHRGG
jgi:membrane-bound lytic murein transglycosylase MltF